MFMFRGAHNVVWKSNMYSQRSRHFLRVRSFSLWSGVNFDNLLGTLCVSDRSCCGSVRIFVMARNPLGTLRVKILTKVL